MHVLYGRLFSRAFLSGYDKALDSIAWPFNLVFRYAGICFAALVILVTILAVALPITLLGENFQDNFKHDLNPEKFKHKKHGVMVDLSGRRPLITERFVSP